MTQATKHTDVQNAHPDRYVYGWTQALQVLKQRVRHSLSQKNGYRVHHPKVERIHVSVNTAQPLHWLQQQGPGQKIYWSNRTHSHQVAGVGQADVWSSHDPVVDLNHQVDKMLSGADADVRYYGGHRFDRHQTRDTKWKPFGEFCFVLPRFEWVLKGQSATLVCNLVLPRDYDRWEQVEAAFNALKPSVSQSFVEIPMLLHRLNIPDYEDWKENIDWALQTFGQSALRKIVFAREVILTLKEGINPAAFMERLAVATPGCFHFLFQPDDDHAFLAATPERLFWQQGRLIRSEAVAGTRPRGATAAEDAQFRADLFGSTKDHREHEFVRLSVKNHLEQVCESVDIEPTPSEMKLARRRHLVTRLTGRLHPGVTSLDVLEQLHPTPAVGGYPHKDALRVLREREHFDRGWYAGPIGWVGRDAAEFAVGIRSGYVQGNKLSLYSGAGIVRGSEPLREWEEIENKISDFLDVMGLVLQPAD